LLRADLVRNQNEGRMRPSGDLAFLIGIVRAAFPCRLLKLCGKGPSAQIGRLLSIADHKRGLKIVIHAGFQNTQP
jgi:hypothetical protein